MTRYTLHVPEQYNDGTDVGNQTFAEIEQRLTNIAGGWTLVHGSGGWSGDDGTVYREPMSLYLVDTAEDLAVGRLLEGLARTIAAALKQEAVYLTKQHIETILVTAREEIPA